MKFDIFIARFPYGRVEDYEVGSFLTRTVSQMKADPRIGEIHNKPYDDTPITMTRNLAIKDAQKVNADILLYIDNDVVPDCCLPTSDRPPMHVRHPDVVRPFWQSSFDFMIEHHGPCVVASPYCGPPPIENIFVFHWANMQSNHPNSDFHLSQFSRREAAGRSGFEHVGALPTGLMLIDMRLFQDKRIKPPHFKYEFEDETESVKVTTEDCFFTRNMSIAGYKIYCNWYAWSGHVKKKVVLPPSILKGDAVNDQYREAVRENNMKSSESLHMFKSKAVMNHGDTGPANKPDPERIRQRPPEAS